MINLRVETLIQPGRCQLSAPSMHKVKTGVQNMYMKCTCTSPFISVMKERLSYLFMQVHGSSYVATTVRSAPVVSLHNATYATAIQGTLSWVASEDEVDLFLNK